MPVDYIQRLRKRQRDKESRERHPETEKSRQRKWYLANKERKAAYAKKYNAENKESRAATAKHYRSSEAGKLCRERMRHKITSANARRKAHIKRATPAFANHDEINSIYALSAFLTMATFGDGYHVDHVAPLRGKRVSGLHVSNNLQILKAKDNLIKGASHACR